jgi:hypothetical protein
MGGSVIRKALRPLSDRQRKLLLADGAGALGPTRDGPSLLHHAEKPAFRFVYLPAMHSMMRHFASVACSPDLIGPDALRRADIRPGERGMEAGGGFGKIVPTAAP